MSSRQASVSDFWSNVKIIDPENPDPCWIYVGPIDLQGYGIYKSSYAHKIAAIIYLKGQVGPVRKNPKCTNRRCIKREHMDCVGWEVDPWESKPYVRKVLEARGNGKYSVDSIKDATGVPIGDIRRALREHATYDIINDVKRYISENRHIPCIPTCTLDTPILLTKV